MKMLKMIRRVIWVAVFLVLTHSAWARDERSIKDLSKALAGLARDVDPAEAERISLIAHTTARSLARDYHVVLNPEFQAFLVNVGARKRGWCGHWAASLGCGLRSHIERKQLPRSDCAQPAFQGRHHPRRLAQGRQIILVPCHKR
jgi:hypothetical protein